MVEIFRTDVSDRPRADAVLALLRRRWPHYGLNFDLEDHDCILRVEAPEVECGAVIALLQQEGCACEQLY